MLTKDKIKHYSRYYQHRLFSSEAEARNEIARMLRKNNDEYGDVFGRTSEDDILKISEEIPVYKLKRSYKIGVIVRAKSKAFSWSNVDIRRTHLYELDGVADILRDRLGPVKMVRISSVIPMESHLKTESGQIAVRNLAHYLKTDEDPKMKAIVYEDTGGIVDGHHRLDAAIFLKQKMIPAQLLKRSE